ncbi:MAG: endonuclease III [Fibrobacteres bacterium]|nr:endonuclease III [Fibrobacterota bacterium]
MENRPTQLAKGAARIVGRVLEREFPDPPVPLDHTDGFTLLVAVVLSAQCTDARVNQVTPVLFSRLGDTPELLAKVAVEDIREIIRPCGLSPAKSQAIQGLSRLVLERHAGQVPSTFSELEALPGVGHKTASVIMSQVFGKPALAVDTHIHRCARRWGLSDGSSVERTERDLKALFPVGRWNRLHLQIIHFARRDCPARGHVLGSCSICSALAAKGYPVSE